MERQHFVANQRQIAALLGHQNAAFVRYERTYRRATSKWLGLTTRRALTAACKQARWVGVGDYHTLDDSRRVFFELLLESRSQKPTVIALEYFTVAEQHMLDAFVAGHLGLRELRQRTGRHLGPPAGEARWESYVDLLRWARSQQVRVVGLDCPNQGRSSLQARDICAAQALLGAWDEQPEAQIWTLVGQLHLAPAHLPRALAKTLGKKAFRPLGPIEGQIVFQNCELLYFRLLAQGLTPERRTLRLGMRSWSLMHTPPTACQLSFLASLEL